MDNAGEKVQTAENGGTEETVVYNEAAEEHAADFGELLKDKSFASEFDRRVQRSIESARAKWTEETERERAEAAAELEKSRRRVRELELQRERDELKNTVSEELTKRGMDAGFAEFLMAEDFERSIPNIDGFEERFNGAVSRAVRMRIAGYAPKSGSPGEKRLEEMSYAEMAALAARDPEKFRSLR